jgi:hypothetical protein
MFASFKVENSFYALYNQIFIQNFVRKFRINTEFLVAMQVLKDF